MSNDRRGPVSSFPCTFGGRQLWADRFFHAGWRIQENVWTGRARLLDPRDRRRARGSPAACRAAYEEIRAREGIRPASRKAVVLLHGLGRTRASMARLARAVADAGFQPAALSYPSTRRCLADHAAWLEGLLDGLGDADEVSFVTHSLGGLVVRAALARRGAWMEWIRPGRLVMIAPPSRGARMADLARSLPPVRWVLGACCADLGAAGAAKVPPPPIPFGIIAGGTGGRRGWSPLIPGDNDGIVAVDEARLDGAADFLLVRALHVAIMTRPETIRAAVNFLRTGRFAGGGGGQESRSA